MLFFSANGVSNSLQRPFLLPTPAVDVSRRCLNPCSGSSSRKISRKISLLISQQNVKSHQVKKVTELRLSKDSDPNSDDTAQPAIQTERHSAPLVEALKVSAEKYCAGFHFPGHNRGRAAPPSLKDLIGLRPFIHDLPELPELDDLFSPKGVIFDSQKLAAELFGSSMTWFLVGGTTCGVQASIMATCSPQDTLILSRNSHISAMSGMVLSGAIPKYIIPEYNSRWDIFGGITCSQVEKAIKELKQEERRIGAVLITSPTYHGICSDVQSISDLCHSHGIPVIVDEAHGAHFKFHHRMPSTCLEQGADIAIQSTHKVLCSLTQSSMLHMSGNIVDKEKISRCLQTLQSTSPSYLLLASLDAARAQLTEKSDTIFNKAMDLASEARYLIGKIPGISVLGSLHFCDNPPLDPLRITVGLWELGHSGYEVDKILCEKFDVIAEVAGTQSLTFALNLGTCGDHVKMLVSGLETLSKNGGFDGRKQDRLCAPFADICMRLSPRDAFFAGKRKVNIDESIGEICGELISSYPPGIPVLVPGEVISENALSYLMDVRGKGAMISGVADSSLTSIVVLRRGKTYFKSARSILQKNWKRTHLGKRSISHSFRMPYRWLMVILFVLILFANIEQNVQI